MPSRETPKIAIRDSLGGPSLASDSLGEFNGWTAGGGYVSSALVWECGSSLFCSHHDNPRKIGKRAPISSSWDRAVRLRDRRLISTVMVPTLMEQTTAVAVGSANLLRIDSSVRRSNRTAARAMSTVASPEKEKEKQKARNGWALVSRRPYGPKVHASIRPFSYRALCVPRSRKALPFGSRPTRTPREGLASSRLLGSASRRPSRRITSSRFSARPRCQP